MEHFADPRWADYVRGVGAAGAKREIEAHLLSGCGECKPVFDFWKWVGDFAARDVAYTPPDNLTRLMKLALYNEQVPETETWTIANLVYDSMSRPLVAGIRSGGTSTRQFVFEAEGLTVDLRFEKKPQSNIIYASGQVLDKQTPLTWMDNTTVILWTEKGKTIDVAEANKHGEFQLQFEAQDQLRISIVTMGRKTVRIPLGSFEA